MPKTFHHNDRQLAYDQTTGTGPGIVFLGGFRSDMEGTKARYLEDWAKSQNRPFLRFDYSGHGTSEGDFLTLGIGDWAADAKAIIETLTEDPQILVGSSMGGWIALLLAKAMPEKIKGLVTEDKLWAGFDADQKAELEKTGVIEMPSAYDDQPYPITSTLIEQGRENLVLRDPLSLPFPTRILHGTSDEDVDISEAYRLFAHAKGPDIRLTAVNAADHRFSDRECLQIIVQAIEEVTTRSAG